MSDEKNVEVDPRFDPAFQRGFDPTVPIEEYIPPRQPRQPVETVVASSEAQPVALPGPVAQPQSTSRAQAAPPRASEMIVVDSDVPKASEQETDATSDAGLETSPSRNPYLLFLGIIAVALVAAGIWLFVRSGEAFNSAQVRSQGDYMSLDATIHSAPFIALLGGATAIGVLFVFAAKYRRRR
jgi:hypothetical protein